MESNTLALNTDDSYVVIKFLGLGSAQFQFYPANVVPSQLLAAAEMLKWQALKQIEDEWQKRNRTKPDKEIAIARVMPSDAK